VGVAVALELLVLEILCQDIRILAVLYQVVQAQQMAVLTLVGVAVAVD
jgi:hypothetical protein